MRINEEIAARVHAELDEEPPPPAAEPRRRRTRRTEDLGQSSKRARREPTLEEGIEEAARRFPTLSGEAASSGEGAVDPDVQDEDGDHEMGHLEETAMSDITHSIPLPKFQSGQSCLHWWASWMKDAAEVPLAHNGRKRPRWYSADTIMYLRYDAIKYCGIMQVPQHLYDIRGWNGQGETVPEKFIRAREPGASSLH